MFNFISTIRLTDQGLKNIKSTCERAEDFRASAAKLGIEVTNIFWTTGGTDGLIVFQAPDEETATAAMLNLCSSGNVQTQTSRAYEAAEMKQLLNKLPG